MSMIMPKDHKSLIVIFTTGHHICTTNQCGKIWRSGHVFFFWTSCDYVILTLTLHFQIFLFHCILFLFLLFRTDDDLDSEVEEVLYSQVHYASALAVSKNSTPGMNVFCLAKFSSCSNNFQKFHKTSLYEEHGLNLLFMHFKPEITVNRNAQYATL